MAQDSLEIRRTTRQADVGVANRDGFWSNYGFTPGFVSIVYFFFVTFVCRQLPLVEPVRRRGREL